MKSFLSTSALAIAAVLMVVLPAGCVAHAPKPNSAKALPVAPSPEANVAGQARTLATEIATYTLSDFQSLPGWQGDDLSQTWQSFLSSCRALDQRGTPWRQVCSGARQINGKSTPVIRAFFEREFSVYQIHDNALHTDGVVTGYFEPEIAGSRTYRPPYIYPVYGKPENMFYLDTRNLPASGIVTAQVVGRQVIVQQNLSTRDLGRTDLYMLDLAQISRDTPLDGKVRLRAEGRHLLPYYTRQEIEAHGAPGARVLAFVSSATDLYVMQLLRSGRIRLPNGNFIYLSYAEQNGQPFRPMLASTAQVHTRDGMIELQADSDNDFFNTANRSQDNNTAVPPVSGLELALPAKSGPVAVPGRRISGAADTGNTDPSYVFFKNTPSNLNSPVGALGTPLWPGYSIAVDPRSVPLGYPVFVSTRLPGGKPMQRLLMAQDTGNTVRGALRADYFFGSGREAARQARLMKRQHGQFWLLLPRGQTIAAGPGATRAHGSAAGSGRLPQCLVPDGDNCAND